MTEREVLDVLRAVTYKPGWSINARFDDMRFERVVSLMISRSATDATSGRPIQLGGGWPVPLPLSALTREHLLEEIYCALRDVEMHEIDEWFKINGVCVTAPHPKGQ